jgi:hypothetical protein
MTEQLEWFDPTSGRLIGTLSFAVSALALGAALLNPAGSNAPELATGGAFLAAITWTVLWRPRVGYSRQVLVLRNMLHTVQLPLAAIESLAVGQVLAVRAGGRRFVSPAVGKSVRAIVRTPARGAVLLPSGSGGEPGAVAAASYADLVLSQIDHRCQEARQASRIEPYSEEQQALAGQVTRERATREIVGLVLTGAAFVAAVLI